MDHRSIHTFFINISEVVEYNFDIIGSTRNMSITINNILTLRMTYGRLTNRSLTSSILANLTRNVRGTTGTTTITSTNSSFRTSSQRGYSYNINRSALLFTPAIPPRPATAIKAILAAALAPYWPTRCNNGTATCWNMFSP